MKKLAFLPFLLAALLPICAKAQVTMSNEPTGRVMVYAGQNPDTNETNLGVRFTRLAMGTLMRDLLSGVSPTGAWSNLQITPGSGNCVTINPGPNTSQLGAVYQLAVDDATKLPPNPGQAPNQLSPDTTKIMVQSTQNTPSSQLCGLNGPGGSGNAIYYLLEAQLGSIDTVNQSMLFVSSSGVTSFQNVNTQRQDVITYQTNSNGGSGTADCNTTFPPAPSVDSGWVEIGTICVPHGTTQITTGQISMYGGTNFNGNSFGSIHFGGNYTSNGGANPSTLTTSNNAQCGGGTGSGLGFAINSQATPIVQLIRSNANGDIFMCGASLRIDNDNGEGPPQIVVNTTVDNASPTVETLYPASGTGSVHTHTGSACATLTICLLGSAVLICTNAGTPNGAMVTLGAGFAQTLIPMVAYANTGTGFQVNFFNASSSGVPANSNVPYGYVCW